MTLIYLATCVCIVSWVVPDKCQESGMTGMMTAWNKMDFERFPATSDEGIFVQTLRKGAKSFHEPSCKQSQYLFGSFVTYALQQYNNKIMGNASSAGLLLIVVPAALHGPEAFFPFYSRVIVDWVLPFFTFQLPPGTLSYMDQSAMLEAALNAVRPEKTHLAADYLFLLTFEQRQGAIGFLAAAATSFYGMSLPVEERKPIHFMFMVMSLLMALANANHAGLSFLGVNPMVTTTGRNIGISFTPFWIACLVFNYLGFVSKTKAD